METNCSTIIPLLIFGGTPALCYTHIMVTLPSQKLPMTILLFMIAESGMDSARINCAHDTAIWLKMITHIHHGTRHCEDCKIYMG